MLTVIALSQLAAFLFAGSTVLQRRAATGPSGSGRPARSTPVAALASPWWLAGWLVNVTGFGVQAVALARGSMSVVQPLVVTQLPIALGLAAASGRRKLPASAWGAAVAVCVGLVLLLAVRGPLPLVTRLDERRLVTALVAQVAAALLLAAGALVRRHGVASRAALLGVATGLCCALTAVLVKQSTGLLVAHGPLALVRAWYPYAMLGSALSGLLLGQWAFARGPFTVALTALTITNPVASYALAVLVEGVPPPHGIGRLAGLLAAGLLLAAGVVVLARDGIGSAPERAAAADLGSLPAQVATVGGPGPDEPGAEGPALRRARRSRL